MSTDLFGQLLKGLAGAGAQGQSNPQPAGGGDVLRSIVDMLGGEGQSGGQVSAARPAGGGLTDLIRGFQDQGLGDVMSSWIGTGENEAVSPEQVRQGLGKERVQEVAQRAGLSIESVLPILATALPLVIDALTPNGRVPDQTALQRGLQGLRGQR